MIKIQKIETGKIIVMKIRSNKKNKKWKCKLE